MNLASVLSLAIGCSKVHATFLRGDHRRFLNGPEEKLAPISFLVYLLAITLYERETDWPHSEAAAEIMAQLSEDGREEGGRESLKRGQSDLGVILVLRPHW